MNEEQKKLLLEIDLLGAMYNIFSQDASSVFDVLKVVLDQFIIPKRVEGEEKILCRFCGGWGLHEDKCPSHDLKAAFLKFFDLELSKKNKSSEEENITEEADNEKNADTESGEDSS